VTTWLTRKHALTKLEGAPMVPPLQTSGGIKGASMVGYVRVIVGGLLAFFAWGCNSIPDDLFAPSPGAGKAESVGTTTQAVGLSRSEIQFEVNTYSFDETLDFFDDRDMRATVTIDGKASYKDLEPGCCDGISALGMPRFSNTIWTHEVLIGSTVTLTVEMVEDDGGNNDVQDIKPGPGSVLELQVDTGTGTFSGDLVPESGFCTFGGGCSACTRPFGEEGDGICFTIRIESNCDRTPFYDTAETLCDGQDGDCDGVYDENWTPRVLCTLCGSPTTCPMTSGGKEVRPACAAECNMAPKFETEWLQYLNAWDFDVAADKLCMLPAVAISGTPLGHVTCTTDGRGGIDSQFIPVPAPPEFAQTCTNGTCVNHCDTDGCVNHVSLDPLGRVWATTPAGVWATQGDSALRLIAPKPPGCSSISQIELVGQADRAYFGPTARPFVRCNTTVFELVPDTGQWITHPQRAWSLGASPRNAFELFFNGPGETQGTPLYFGMKPDSSYRPLWILVDAEDRVGGAYVMGGEVSQGLIRQWNGSTLDPVPDLSNPLAFPHITDGKYDNLLAIPTSGETGAPLKIAEGGGLGVGGPSPAGKTDVLWILNNSFRVYSYNLAPVPPDVTGSFRGNDRLPITALALAVAGETPEAVCQDVVVDADEACTAFVGVGQIDAGSFDPNGDPLTLRLSAEGLFPLGSTTVTLFASDGQTESNCTATITVVDTTPPVITLPSTASTNLCQTAGSVNVGEATVTDNCSADVEGQVIALNGVPLSPPVDVIDGQAVLGIGTNTIRWQATDGENPVELTQTVNVGSKIQASQSFVVGDRASVLLAPGVGAAVLSSGGLETRIGNDARVGAIMSVGPVRVLDRSIAQGAVLSAGEVTVSPTASTGPVTRFGSVVLPVLPSLPSFPSPTGGSFVVNSGQNLSRAPGSYDSVTLNGGSLVLAAGDYFFRSLTINTNVRVVVSPSTRIFVRDQLTFRSPFILANGMPQAITLGFGGTTLYLEAAFTGTLWAPSALVVFGSGQSTSNRGSFYARGIEVRPGSTLTCAP
jgi:hypothetical protein